MILKILLFAYLNYQVSKATSQSVNVANSFVTWENLGSETKFTVNSKLGGANLKNSWIAVGVNSGPLMSGTNAIVCRYSSTVRTVTHYLNIGYRSALFDLKRPTLGITNAKVDVVNSNLTCSFHRANSIKINGYKIINESSQLNILVAYNQGDFGYHSKNGASSKIKFKVKSNSISIQTTSRTKAVPTTMTKLCTSNPCLNNGICSLSGEFYTCTCKTGFYGTNCQFFQQTKAATTTSTLKPCVFSPCLNGASCATDGTSYKCLCAPNYTGSNCQKLNPCYQNPCLNGGVCSSSGDYYICTCKAGSYGSICQFGSF